jgi:hypothetical protein
VLSAPEVDSAIGYWFGCHILVAVGADLGLQNIMLVAKVAIPITEIVREISILTLMVASSGFLCVVRNVFQYQLIVNLQAYAPDIYPRSALHAGGSALQDAFFTQLCLLLQAYNKAVMHALSVAVTFNALPIIGSIFMRRLSLK